MKKFLSIFSLLLMLILLLPTFSMLAADDVSSSADKKTIYSLDFSTLSSLPTGLEYGYKGKGASFGYLGTSPSLSVSLNTTKGVMSVSGNDADSFVAFPKINAVTYLYEAEIVVTSASGSIGLANNIYDNLNGTNAGAQWLTIYVGATTVPYSIRKSVSSDSAKTKITPPSDFKNIKSGESVKLGVASYGGVNYYYMNGNLITSCKQISPNSNLGYDRVGFFSYGASYEVKKITVTELQTSKETKESTLTFTLFSDFHYKDGMYMSTIADLESILARAEASNSAFVMSAGDFCNDFKGSPELINTYHNYRRSNGSLLPAYNVYGNHELETSGNSMANVTKTLTNDKNVVWGTATGAFDQNIGYYYFESNGFRIVCLDTQYSYNTSTGEWEHNKAASCGAPSGNTKKGSLGPVQLEWLDKVLVDAAINDIPCIVVSHDGMSGLFATSSSDAEAVRKIFKKANTANPDTVLMAINGHLHSNNQGYNDGVFYLDMHTVRNCVWRSGGTAHYNSSHTFKKSVYNEYGEYVKTVDAKLNDLSMGSQTWFAADPLSAVITINSDGVIEINGTESSWLYDVVPDNLKESNKPRVTSGTFWDCGSKGHLKDAETYWQYDEESHWNVCPSILCNANYNEFNHSFDCEVVSAEYFASEGNGEIRYYKSCICGFAGTDTFAVASTNEESTETETETETEIETEATTEKSTETETEATTEDSTETEVKTTIKETSTDSTDVPTERVGCRSAVVTGALSIGVSAVAASVVLKKKKRK